LFGRANKLCDLTLRETGMVDLASDKVNSRIVGTSIFLIIPAYLMHVIDRIQSFGWLHFLSQSFHFLQLFVGRTMKFANVPSDNKDPASIELFNLPTSGGLISRFSLMILSILLWVCLKPLTLNTIAGFILGEALQYPVNARVLNNNSYPISGLPVYAKVQGISFRDPDMSTMCNVITTSRNSLQVFCFAVTFPMQIPLKCFDCFDWNCFDC
jgi:hypothetical protein